LSKRINDCDTDEDDVTDHANPSLAVQLDRTRKLPESSQLENEQKLRLVADLTQQVEDQGKEIVDLKARLQILLTYVVLSLILVNRLNRYLVTCKPLSITEQLSEEIICYSKELRDESFHRYGQHDVIQYTV
jgi:hypothetical protein